MKHGPMKNLLNFGVDLNFKADTQIVFHFHQYCKIEHLALVEVCLLSVPFINLLFYFSFLKHCKLNTFGYETVGWRKFKLRLRLTFLSIF